ncbi:hypothetical protein ACFS4T_18685 [Pseudomonas lini]
MLWLDAADASKMTLDAHGRLLRWHDKSGKSNDVTVDDAASTALPLRVENAMNGHSVVRFSGASAFLGKTIRAAKGPVTVLVVSRRLTEQSSGETWQRLFSSRPQIADNDNVAPNFAISVHQPTAYEPTLFFSGTQRRAHRPLRGGAQRSRQHRRPARRHRRSTGVRPPPGLARGTAARVSVSGEQVVCRHAQGCQYLDPCRPSGHNTETDQRPTAAVRSGQCRPMEAGPTILRRLRWCDP